MLATHFTKLHPDQAMLAGLVHKISAQPVLSYVEENNALLNDGQALDKLIEKLHPIIGSYILKVWKFPKALQAVPSQYLKFDRETDKGDYVDLVTVAVLQEHADTEHPYTQLDWSTIGAFERLGIDPEVEMAEVVDVEGEDIKGLLE